MNRNEKTLNAIIARFNKEWQAVAEKAIKELYKLVEGGKKVDVAVKVLERKYPELFQLPGLIDSLVEAAAYGYGIVPEVLTAATYAKMATAMERPWASDGMTLSKRLHGATKQMREAIVDTIRTQLNLNASWTNAARELYDGYNSGKAVVREQDLPNYLRLVRHATAGSPEQLRAARKAWNNINRLARNGAPTKSLKAAYNQLVQQALTGSDEAMQKACWVAVQEKSRYVAERIARTEMARAYADGFLADIEVDDDVVAVKWKTGTRHPVFDICDMYAKADMYGLGPGIYPKDKLPKLPAHPHCMCKLVKIYAADLDGKKAKENIEGAVNDYLEKLSDNQRMQLMGINGAKAWQSGESWQDYLRGWQGLGKQESRLREILLQLHADEKTDDESMAKNLAPPTDRFIASIAKKYNMKYTLGKKGEDRFYSDDGVPIYPLNDGFVGEPEKITLKAGKMLVDRYGPVYGGYVSPKNVSFEERALPRTTSKTLYHVFVIKKDIADVQSGLAAAWFGEVGGGIQYKLPMNTKQLLEDGYMELVEDDI